MFSYIKPAYCNHFQNSVISSAWKAVQRRQPKPSYVSKYPTLELCFSFSEHLKEFANRYSQSYILQLLDLIANPSSF